MWSIIIDIINKSDPFRSTPIPELEQNLSIPIHSLIILAASVFGGIWECETDRLQEGVTSFLPYQTMDFVVLILDRW